MQIQNGAIRTTLILAAATALAGCSRSEMQFHFAAADLGSKEPKLTFYRVTVRGYSGGSTSHLLTGFYDADALHALFGKVEEPKAAQSGTEKAQSAEHDGSVIVEFDPLSKKWRVVKDTERFTIFWGTNADAMAQQVGAFAESNQTGDDLASIMAAAAGRDKFDALRTSQRTAEEKDGSRSKLSEALSSLKSRVDEIMKEKDAAGAALPDPQKIAKIRAVVRDAANRAASGAGYSKELPNDPAQAMEAAKVAAEILKAMPKVGS